MSVRRFTVAVIALLAAVLFGAACGDRQGAQVAAETDDPYYVQGVTLMRQGRNPEALTSFLKVIDKRGERGAAESHLQAGTIYLHHIKDPLYAYYHFRKYLELQPNSTQAELVRGQVKAAVREFAKTVPGRPVEENAIRVQTNEEIGKLQREIEALRAELAAVRGGAVAAVNRPARMINVPVPSRTNTASVTPITNAPQTTTVPTLPPGGSGRVIASPQASPGTGRVAAPTQPGSIRAATASPTPTGAGRAATPARSASGAPGPSHTVVAKDTLFSLSKKYGVRMEDLAAANGLPSVASPLKLGTVLKIPAPAPAGR